MKSGLRLSALAITLACLGGAGCSSTDGGSHTHVSGGVYYGVGFYDPWYYGGDYDDIDVIVTPPDRPDKPTAPVKPTHPIELPPTATPKPSQPIARPSTPSPRPMPSIPRTPMPRVRMR